ncbi:response regulator [Sphingomonas sp. SRS2]|uniref:response regulator n=1 Tax=Sphingomonas sp. SRS2 TaxID=133190 RepID=UPI000618478E|nr:response regulator [Sphingomonas sp. SRS2]KKC27120.1 chemotaxis protein CheY [Sphingomonas sp. SRS2]
MSDSLSILYVDDEADIRMIVEMALQLRPGIEVRTAISGDAAYDMLQSASWRPELMMVDVMMPGLTGPELMDKLRADPDTAAIPIIFVTARARPQDIQAYVAQGALGVITKPFDPINLADQVLGLVRSIK